MNKAAHLVVIQDSPTTGRMATTSSRWEMIRQAGILWPRGRVRKQTCWTLTTGMMCPWARPLRLRIVATVVIQQVLLHNRRRMRML
jgi:hypothetical protein